MRPSRGHDIIVVGASAGGVEALVSLAQGLPGELPAAVFVVLHMPPNGRSHLPEILSRAGLLTALQPEDGQIIEHGRIYVARPDHHLLIDRDRVRVTRGPKENRTRPAIDPLFRSAARAHGPRVIGVVLSGALDDGSAGLSAIKRMGGLAIVQSPADALVSDMPTNALDYVQVDHVTSAQEIGPLLGQLARQPAPEGDIPVSEDLDRDTRIAEGDQSVIPTIPPGNLTVYACPDCGGPLWEAHDGTLTRFRCRNGHGYTPDSLLEGQTSGLEEALWEALNTLESSAQFAERMARDAQKRGLHILAERMEEKAARTVGRVRLLREALLVSDDDSVVASGLAGAQGGPRVGAHGADPRAQPTTPQD